MSGGHNKVQPWAICSINTSVQMMCFIMYTDSPQASMPHTLLYRYTPTVQPEDVKHTQTFTPTEESLVAS